MAQARIDEAVRHAGAAPHASHAAVASTDEAQAQSLAEQVGRVMYSGDAASQGLGMTLDRIGPGRSCMSMTVRADMLNGHGTCHGGFIFALADSAFAFACNARNQSTVGSGCTIDYLAPARQGDVLTAEAVERSLSGRTGVYDVAVVNQAGRTVAIFRGRSYRIQGSIVPDAGP